tara:strand:- start:2408 stop:4264 length:1857 start_codon:yes stop_codon:yes gene_type:complete
MIKKIFYITLFCFIPLLSQEFNFLNFPVQESGRIKPLDTYARNQLLIFYGKDYFLDDLEGEKIKAIDWLTNLLHNPSEELSKKIFHISKWDNSPEVEVALGLDNKETHLYSFYELIQSFQDNQNLLESLRNKSKDDYTHVEQQIVDIYSKVVLLDEIAHSFVCLIPQISINDIDVREALKIEENLKVSYFFFVDNIELFSPLMEELLEVDPENWSAKHKELNRVAIELHRISQYGYANAIKIIPSDLDGERWYSPWEIVAKDEISNSERSILIQIESYLNNFSKGSYSAPDPKFYLDSNIEDINKYRLDREVQYNNIKYFNKSLLFYLIALIILSLSTILKSPLLRPLIFLLMIFGFVLHLVGIIDRMIIMQRPPVSTLYESIIFVNCVLILIALIFERIRKDSLSFFAGLLGGVVLHYVGIKYASDGDTLGMLVAVLNSNFWLSIHVTTITFGYGVSLLSGLMAHMYLIRASFFKADKLQLKSLYNNVYVLTLIALFFTLFGTILGGIWADQSWGRFWGWDPKENGALLIVMWHLMVLHLRVSGMVKPLAFCLFASLVNIIVALAWFGVNLLNVGLHSYGFTDSVATNLFLFIAFEIVICISLYYYAKATNNKKILN